MEFAIRYPQHFAVMFEIPLQYDAYPATQAAGARAFGTLVAYVEACQAAGVLPPGDPKPFALLAWSMVHGASQTRHWPKTSAHGNHRNIALYRSGDCSAGAWPGARSRTGTLTTGGAHLLRRIKQHAGENMMTSSKRRCMVGAALLLGVLAAPPAAWANLKLFMKDGSYQLVTGYEVHGDRVRYFSVERSDWEEIPTSLVDFDATKRAQEETKATQKQEIDEAKQVDQERFYKPPDQGLEVAPGLRLPGDDGIFTVVGKRVVRLVQSTGEVVTDKKRAAMVLAVPLPVVKTRSLVVLEGAKAPIRLSDPLPTFYVQSSEGLGTKLELVHVKPGKEARVVEDVETARGKNGKASEERTMVSLERKQVATNVYTLRPLKPLEAGEYALGEVVDDKLNLEVWDFGYEKWEVAK